MNDDGNCLFRAISDQLYSHDRDHEKLRKEITDYMVENRQHYTNFIHEDFDWYIANMKTNKTYATNVEIQGNIQKILFFNLNILFYFIYKAFAEKENCQVLIYSDQSIGEPPLSINPYEKEPTKSIMLSYQRGNHYNSVIPFDDYSRVNHNNTRNNSSPNNSAGSSSSNKTECPYCGSFVDQELETHMLTDCSVYQSVFN